MAGSIERGYVYSVDTLRPAAVRADAVRRALTLLFDHDREIYRKFNRDFDRELRARVSNLIAFFEGKSDEWNYFRPEVRATLSELANPDAIPRLNEDIRKQMSRSEKRKLLVWLRSLIPDLH